MPGVRPASSFTYGMQPFAAAAWEPNVGEWVCTQKELARALQVLLGTTSHIRRILPGSKSHKTRVYGRGAILFHFHHSLACLLALSLTHPLTDAPTRLENGIPLDLFMVPLARTVAGMLMTADGEVYHVVRGVLVHQALPTEDAFPL